MKRRYPTRRYSIDSNSRPPYKDHSFKFNSLFEFVDYAEKTPKFRHEHDQYGSSFTGTDSFTDAVKLAREGWSEGTDKLMKLANVITSKVTSLIDVPTLNYDTTGLDFDMGRYLDGVPESWYYFEHKTRDGVGFEQVRIVVNISASGGVSKEILTARGATVAGLVLALEQSGKRVELIAVAPWSASQSDFYNGPKLGPFINTSVLLKSPDQQIDIDRLAFVLAHPSMLRRLDFAVTETIENWRPRGIGFPIELPDGQDRGDIHIDRASLGEMQWQNERTAETWILEQLRKQGVHLIGETETMK
jgi:hypothetical protein